MRSLIGLGSPGSCAKPVGRETLPTESGFSEEGGVESFAG